MTAHNALPAGDMIRMARNVSGIVMLVCGWSAAALGATGSNGNCQDISNNLKSLQIPAVELSITLVDLPDTSVELGLLEPKGPVDAVESTSDSTAPLLFLTPRVASMLREVFEDMNVLDDETVGTAANNVGKRETTFPPIAEGSADKSLLPILEDSESRAPEQTIPRFQRPMYRTDI